MLVDEQRLLAWLDGELGPEEAAAVAATVAKDPELSALADAHRALAGRLRSGFAPLLGAPAPEALVAAARFPENDVIDLAAARTARNASARRTVLPQWAAIAATLAIGVIAGRTSNSLGPQPMLTQTHQGLEADGPLATALEAQLASVAPSAAVRVIVTFRAQDGRVCRSWSTARQEGIACRAEDAWKIAATFSRPAQSQADYRMASSNSPQLLALLDEMIAGDPFGPEQERAAKRQGWK